MCRARRWFFASFLILVAASAPATRSHATDVDGGNDCPKPIVDRGDAPEGMQAYPGVLAAFPTCTTPGPIGTQTPGCPPISTLPGPAGFVAHARAAGPSYWLGCFAGQGGLDHDPGAKVNDSGSLISGCNSLQNVDCFETAFGLTFGQDECYGSNDAGLTAAVSFVPCDPSRVTFSVWDCGINDRQVYLNILVDWNQDGDWNDGFLCPNGCAYEWAVKNAVINIGPGCKTITSPTFFAGPNNGNGWMRVTLSDQPVTDDFPWAGSANVPSQTLSNGETEDYPVTIGNTSGGLCPDYDDWGDAPEDAAAYSNGTIGRFPTCGAPTLPGTPDLACAPISGPPGLTGFVRHVAGSLDPKFWFGCGDPAAGTNGVDPEHNGKMNDTGAIASLCDPALGVDGVEPAFSLNFGQDEHIADPGFDAGIRAPVVFNACSRESVGFYVLNCDSLELVQAFLNVLVDMNQDGDWNDNFLCGSQCAYEWPVKNQPVTIPVGCTFMTSPTFLMGPNGGEGWMRLTLSLTPVGNDFPWEGSAGSSGTGFILCGETEDYPVTINGPDTCQVAYEDFGDAPEKIDAYTTGVVGHFPTCLSVTGPGTQQVQCGTAQSTAPGITGYVKHVALATDAEHFWLGCGQGSYPLLAVDSEADGKVNVGAPFGGPSSCNALVNTDCVESLIGAGMNQDECVGDLDAGIGTPTFFFACSTGTVNFDAFNCAGHAVTAYLNLLVDWDHDGDWNDNLSTCSPAACAAEWAVKNLSITMLPGCATFTAPPFTTGLVPGRAWLRLTLSREPAPNDFPWNGTAGMPAGQFSGGETEDYAVNVLPNPLTDVGDIEPAGSLWLGAPIPNPAREAVAIPFALPRAAEISLAIYDLAGRRLMELRQGRIEAGSHRVEWSFRDASGREVAPGHYIVKLRAGDRTLTRQVIRLR